MADGVKVGTGYIQIMPEMKDFTSSLKSETGKELETAGQSGGSKFGSGFKKGVAVIGAATVAAGAAVGAVTKAAISEFADYEQLVGGVNKLFGDMDYQTVVDNASQAFRTAGMSSNEYMETVTGFSAALISSLGNDTSEAAGIADMAIRDMSDNANVFGSDMETIQNAYQGFAKGNYTMLDNLKLGYGGTKTEMERLISDANLVKEANGEMADLSINSFADVVEAIHIMQKEMNISGTTANEASSTISGSVSSMQSAWHNLLSGLADENQDFGQLVDNLIGTIVGFADASGERVGGVINNIMPRVQIALEGISTLVTTMVPEILGYLPGLIESLLPNLIEGATSLVTSFIDVLPDILDVIVQQLPTMLETIGTGIITSIGSLTENLPQLADTLSTAIKGILEYVANNADEIVSTVTEFLSTALSEGIRVLSENTGALATALFAVVKAVIKAAVENPELLVMVAGIAALKSIGSTIISVISNGLSGAKSTLTGMIKNVITGAAQDAGSETAGANIGSEMASGTGNSFSSGLKTALGTIAASAVIVEGAKGVWGAYKGYVDEQIKNNPGWQEERTRVEELAASQGTLGEKYEYLNSKLGGHLDLLENYQTDSNAALDVLYQWNGGLAESQEGWYEVAQAMGYHGLATVGVAENLKMMYGDLYDTYEAEKQAAEGTETFTEAAGTMGGSIDEIIPGITQQFQATFGTDVPAALQNAIQTASTAGVEIPSALIDSIVVGLANGTMSVDDAVQSIVDLMDQSEGASTLGAKTGEAFTTSAAEVVVDERPQVESACKGVAEAMDASDTSGQSGTNTGSSFNDGLAGTEGAISSTAEGIADTVTSAMDPLPGEMSAAGDESGSNLESGFGNWRGTISGTVDETYQFFYSTLGTMLPPLMSQWGSDSAQKFNSGLKIWSSDISATAQSMSTGIQTAMSGLPGELYSVGSNAGAGLYNGLNAWSGALSSLAWNIANQINAAARAALQIHSPSKVMEEIGQYTAEGLAVGIDVGTVDVIESTDNMMDALSGTAVSYDHVQTVQSGDSSYHQQVLALLEDLRGLKVVMDSGEVVGVLAPEINNNLERLRLMQERG